MNTIEGLKEVCSKPGWNGYDCNPISDLIFKRAEQLEPYIPKSYELFPGADNSLQWESPDNNVCIEIYEECFYISSSLEFEDSVPYYSLEEVIKRIKQLK